MLASVTDVAEARIAVDAGADIIDCKDPSRGALGALPLAEIAAIRADVPRGLPVSATIGDLPPEPDLLARAAADVAAAGVDYVKIGFFAGGDARAAIARLGRLDCGCARLVGVLLADRMPDWELIDDMARAGFAGVLLDTADKTTGSLPDLWSAELLAGFIAGVRGQGMFAGLAGSLRLRHIPGLLQLGPDVLGFRGALCAGYTRVAGIDPAAMAQVRRAMPCVSKAFAAAGLEAAQ